MSGPCPATRVLEDIAADRSASDADSGHVAACDSCQAVLCEIRENWQFLSRAAAALREAEIDARASATRSAPIEIPGFELLDEISRGGQGVVLRAVQSDTKRPAAVKMLLSGAFATPRQARRFDREIELAASLRHPNIVSIFESGTTADGSRYVAMEYIDGLPLDRFLQQVPADDRAHIQRVVPLMTATVDALRHAHGNGVIHRDLKPSNILVDAAGSPHVVDFGLARPVEPEGDATLTGEFAGTPLFAAPEQFRGSADSIDVRTDVYALGVLLYFALTGRCPHNGASLRELMRRIVEDSPDRPSQHNSHVDDDLDTIVLKALAKEKERRYQSAAELHDDLERYTRGEAIAAKRDSAIYMLRKTVGRYRLAFVAGTTIVILAAAMAIQAARSADRLRIERDQANAARTEAGRQRNIAVAVKNFMQQIVSDADPNKRGRPDLTMREVLTAAIADVEGGRFATDGEVEAEVRLTLAATLEPLGEIDLAEAQCHRAIDLLESLHGREHASLVPGLALLSSLRDNRADVAGALELQRRVLALLRRTHDELSDEVQTAQRGLCVLILRNGDTNTAETLAAELVENARTRHGEDSPQYDLARECMVSVLQVRGSQVEAAQLALEIASRAEARHSSASLELGTIISAAVAALNSTGDPKAIEFGRRALAIFLARLGPQAEDTARAYHNLAVAYFRAGDLASASENANHAADIVSRLTTYDPRGRAEVFNLAAVLCVSRGEVRRAVPHMRQAFSIAQEFSSPRSEELAGKMNNLAIVQVQTGELDAGIALFREALEIRQELHPFEDHPSVAEGLCNLGFALYVAQQSSEAVSLLRDGTEMRSRTLGPDHPKTAESMVTWAAALIDLDRFDEAQQHLDSAATIFEFAGIRNPSVPRERARWYLRRGRPHDARDILMSVVPQSGETPDRNMLLAEIVLGEVLIALRCDEDAEDRLRSVYARAVRGYGNDSFVTRRAAEVMAQCHAARGDAETAAQWRASPPDPNALP